MRPRMRRLALVLAIGLLAGACAAPSTPTPFAPLLAEVEPILLPLPAEFASSRLEYSGLGQWREWIVLLPQYPDRLADSLVAARASDIEAWLVAPARNTIDFKRVRFDDGGLAKSVAGFEGFEAISFRGDDVVVTIEASPRGMLGHIVRGRVVGDMEAIVLDPASRMDVRPRALLANYSDESIVIAGDVAYTLYEANGVNASAAPSARAFALMPDGTLNERRPLELPAIEYRITDCTPPDASGQFWCINYFFPGDESKLKPAPDAISQRWGTGATHRAGKGVERVLAMRIDGAQFSLVDRAPILLALRSDGQFRNWEGIARLGNRGFLLITDTHPETIFAFVRGAP